MLTRPIALRVALAALLLLTAPSMRTYPLDGAAATGIRRLIGYRLIHEGKIKSAVVRLPPGALLTSDQILLRLKAANPAFDITPGLAHDPYLQAGIERIFAAHDPSYAVSLLDISDPQKPLYASLRGDEKKIPGSVGKLCVVTGLFAALAANWPAIPDRQKVLRETMIEADSFVFTDGKTVPIYNEGDPAVVNRTIALGDRFRLWEWADHMLSQSSNAAGSTVWKQVMMIRHFGAAYPSTKAQQDAFLKDTPKAELSKLSLAVLDEPMAASGLDTTRMRLGTFFTRNASRAIPGSASYACPNELLRWLVKMEQGKIVDEWSSLEIKKLLYFVRPRYRYAASPALAKAAVFFKSGSLFECRPEPGFPCKQYAGNVTNLMNSVAVVESGEKRYLIALMSNVLRVNSAVEHETIAGEIEKLIQGPRR
ncbi:MAG TPA: hypothetical protein VE959_30020 [Bryobacteraceae bacterium]|nr:hypothetical protein [Bryobacteraceae bacterium]